MGDEFSTPLTSPFYPKPPLHYIDAKLFLALFNATEESLQKLLPDPLRPTDMGLTAMLHAYQPCKETGPFMESALLIQCIYENPDTGEEDVGLYFSNAFASTDVAIAVGREVWGYPRKYANISMKWKDDTLVATTERGGEVLMRATCTFDDEGDWIDSGPNINLKLIPSADADGIDFAALTAAHVVYNVKNGRSGDVEVEFFKGSYDDLTLVEMVNPMIGLYFDTDITVPPAKIIKTLDL
jgi:acetoacetate decarboxylase